LYNEKLCLKIGYKNQPIQFSPKRSMISNHIRSPSTS